MKTKIGLILVVLGMLFQSLNADITTGLVAYYPFNGNANDASGNSNNGTVKGAQLTTDRNGKANSAYHFNGVSDHITLNPSATLSLGASGFTLSAWVNAEKVYDTSPENDQMQIIVADGSLCVNQSSYLLAFVKNNLHLLFAGSANYPNSQLQDAKFYKPFEVNTYYHIATVYDGDKVYGYVNGNLISSQDVDNGIKPYPLDDYVIIGMHPSVAEHGWPQSSTDGEGEFKGIIDDVRIYNRGLTASDIKELYDSEKPQDSGLVAYYPFNGNANDESGNGNNGTVNGATLTTDRFGNANSAYSFNGSSDFINVPDSNTLDLTNKMTLCAWTKVSEIRSHYSDFLLGKGRSSIGTGYGLNNYDYSGNDGTPQGPSIVLHNGTDMGYAVSDVSKAILNKWQFIVGTYDGQVFNIYVDGVLCNSFNNNVAMTLINSTEPLNIGRETSGLARYHKGLIDDVRIYNRPLTASEVKELYDSEKPQPSDLVAYYPFNGNANDESGNGNNGTVTGATLATDRFGNANSAYYFDGSSNFIEVNSSISLDQTSMTAITYSVWFSPDDTCGSGVDNQRLLYVCDTPHTGQNDIDYKFSTGKAVVCYYNPTGWYDLTGNTQLDKKIWHNIVVVYDYTASSTKIYVNGVLDGETTALVGKPLNAGLTLGRSVGNPWFYKGLIDDVRIYNRALSAEEVAALYGGVSLTMAVSPTEVGTTVPTIGTSIVKKDEAVTITATPATGYSFVRWTATPSSNASIASSSSPDTTVTLSSDATVTAIFTPNAGSGALANSKVRIIVDNSKQYKDSISIVKGKLPAGFVKPVEGDPLIIQVDAWTLSVNGGYKASGDKITYKGETVVKIKGHASSFAKASHFAQEATRDRPADMKAVNSNVKTHAEAVNSNGGTKTAEKSIKGNKYQLVLDLKKLEWNLRIANADLSTGSPLDSFDGLDVMLNVNGTPIGQNIGTDDLVKWRFTSTKNTSEKLSLGGEEWLNFAVNKADGSSIGDKPSKDSFTVGNGTGDIITFDSATDSVTVLIDKFKIALDDADVGSAWKSGNDRHIFKGTFAGVTVVQFVLDLSKNSASWKFKVSKADFWDDIDGSDGLDFRVIIGNYQGGLRLDADQTTTMSYPQK